MSTSGRSVTAVRQADAASHVRTSMWLRAATLRQRARKPAEQSNVNTIGIVITFAPSDRSDM
jgi:hypothetical protein